MIKAHDFKLPKGTNYTVGSKGMVFVHGKKMEWKVHLPNMLNEIISCNAEMGIFYRPFQILTRILYRLAKRALELNDPELNEIMLKLSLYEVENDNDKVKKSL